MFLVNIPIVIVGLLAGIFLIPTSKDPSAPRLDPIGALLSIVGLVSLLYGAVSRWLSEYERFAEQTAAAARSLLSAAAPRMRSTPRTQSDCDPPRRLFGLVFESRPPPVAA